MNASPTFLSLFAGIGGFDLALERAGFRCVGQVELDPFCQCILTARFAHTPGWTDVREWQGNGHEPPDFLVGGFPCQDFSVAGRRAGLVGYRGTLFWEIVRIAKEVRPAWGLFENVPGLLSSHHGRDFWAILQGLRECWPAVGWRILDSRYFGVPQRRRRVFFVCGPSEKSVATVLFESESGGGHPPAGEKAGTELARDIAASLRGIGGTPRGFNLDAEQGLVVTALRHLGSGGPDDNEAQGGHLIVAPETAATLKQRGRGATDEVMDNLVVGQCHGSNVGPMGALRKGDGGLTSGVPFVAHPLTAEGADASEDGTGRGTPIMPIQYAEQWGRDKRQNGMGLGEDGDPSFTLDASYPHGVGTSAIVRRLTPMECERLQAFPDGWTCLCQPLKNYATDPEQAAWDCTCPDGRRYRALGNAVTVSVVEWLARRAVPFWERA